MTAATKGSETSPARPFFWELQPGRRYSWCACGRSTRQPFCDGRSHIGTGHTPLIFQSGPRSEEVLLCGCKQTGTPPFCDGTHNNLPGGYSGDERSADELAGLRLVESDAEGVRMLDGRCFVVAPDQGRPAGERIWLRPIIGPQFGAEHQSQFHLRLEEGRSPIYRLPSDGIVFIMEGTGTAELSGRTFSLAPLDGLYIRAGEDVRFSAETPLSVFISVCPMVDRLADTEAMSTEFDSRYPERVVRVDAEQRTEMGPRYFQMLVDKRIGSMTAAQFIGHIPQSRAKMHRHLYEEALIIVSGSGVLWNDSCFTRVAAGDVVFLPRKHAHSLECLAEQGMLVVGVIHPGDNPAINY